MGNKLIVTAAPHITSADSTQKIMQRVCIAMLPALVASVIIFGINALIITVVTVAACVIFEYLYCKLVGREVSIGDFLRCGHRPAAGLQPALHAALVDAHCGCLHRHRGCEASPSAAWVTTLPTPLSWAVSPWPWALPGRMSTYGFPREWTPPLLLPLCPPRLKALTMSLCCWALTGRVLGETCAIALIIGGVYLIVTKVISPTIPVTYLATVAVLSLIAGKDPIYQLLSGGLLLGAFFMATDYVTSPTTTKGKLVFGIGLGIITCAIRFLGRMNEGVSFAILLMNLMVPYIEVLTRQDRLGIAKVKKSKEDAAK